MSFTKEEVQEALKDPSFRQAVQEALMPMPKIPPWVYLRATILIGLLNFFLTILILWRIR